MVIKNNFFAYYSAYNLDVVVSSWSKSLIDCMKKGDSRLEDDCHLEVRKYTVPAQMALEYTLGDHLCH